MYKQVSISTSKATNATRLTWVDHARGLAIMLVVYRHVVVGMKRAGIEVSDFMYNIQQVFYNFRMPVFFVLSGIFVAAGLKRKGRLTILKERSATLLYPYILWATVLVMVQILFSSYTNAKRSWWDILSIFTQPRVIDHLWYLFALFNTSLLYLFLSKWIKKDWLHLLVAIAFYCVSEVPAVKEYSLVSDICYFYAYFLAGTFFSALILNAGKREQLLGPKNLKWLLPLFILGQYFWFTHMHEDKLFLLFLLINLFACYFVYIIAYSISQWPNNRWLSYLGEHSLYIYILHVPIAAAIRGVFIHFGAAGEPLLILMACWTAGLLIPILLYRLLKPFGFEWLFSLRQKK